MLTNIYNLYIYLSYIYYTYIYYAYIYNAYIYMHMCVYVYIIIIDSLYLVSISMC